MDKKLFFAPLILSSTSGGSETVIGQGTGEGTGMPQGMSYEDWWDEIAWGGGNPDADYNGDGVVDRDDYDYYIENELWKG